MAVGHTNSVVDHRMDNDSLVGPSSLLVAVDGSDLPFDGDDQKEGNEARDLLDLPHLSAAIQAGPSYHFKPESSVEISQALERRDDR